MRHSTEPARDQIGRYTVEQRCDCCAQPIHGEHVTDEEACGTGDGPGFYLCTRRRCLAWHSALPVSARRLLFAAGRARTAPHDRQQEG